MKNPPMKIVTIGEISMMFVAVPETHELTSFELSEHVTKYIGRLKEFNTLDVLKNWRKDNFDVEKLFTDKLIHWKWNFKEFPNPVGVLIKYIIKD